MFALAANKPAEFARLALQFPERNANPLYSDWGAAYYAATYPEADDLSFASDDSFVRCNPHNGTVSYFGMPIAPIGNYHDNLGGILCGRSILINTKWASSDTRIDTSWATCDLSLSEAQLHKHIRKSYTSLINAGRRDLRVVYYNGQTCEHWMLSLYRDFHARVAGRITRSEASWAATRDMIVNDHAELVLGYRDDLLVAGLIIFYGTERAYYASAVNLRSQFDKPLGHFLLWDAILRSRARGLRWFDLGELPEHGTALKKEYNIGHFKAGFATQIESRSAWLTCT